MSVLLTELISAFSHTCSAKVHTEHCLICDVFYTKVRKVAKRKSGLRLLLPYIPTDNELLRTDSQLQRTAVFILPNIPVSTLKSCVTELRILLSSTGFVMHAFNVVIPPSHVVFMFIDLRGNSNYKLPQDSDTPTTVVQLVNKQHETVFPMTNNKLIVITCCGFAALRAFIVYAQTRQSRFTLSELMLAFTNDTSITISSNSQQQKITSILI